MYIERAISQKLEYMAEHFPVVLITGARQVGKTTLLNRYKENRSGIAYVTLDYPVLRNLAKEDPELFLQQYSPPLIIDEIQYAPELLPYIKIRADREQKNGMYYLTGSQMFHLMRNVSESLAGRAGILTMYPLSDAEKERRSSRPFLPSNITVFESNITATEIFEKIYRGSMPKMSADLQISPDDFYGSYMQTYLERDLRDFVKIKDETKFIRFMCCVAARVSQELNLADIGRDVGIDKKTAENWLSLLVTSGVVYLMPAYSGNTIKRIIKRPKIYFMDTGLACYLSMWNNPRSLELSAVSGAFFEDYVISEIIKSYANSGIDTRSRLCYYRDTSGKEIDLLILENGNICPVEIKKSAAPKRDAVKNFEVLGDLPAKRGRGGVICLSPYAYPLDADSQAIPVSAI